MPVRYFRHIKTLAAFAIGVILSHPAAAGPIIWNPGAAGLAGAPAFTADALKANEVSHIVFTGPTTFFEHGFVKITGISNGGVVSTPTGLNSTYSLYFDFTATGSVATGQIATFGLTLFGVNGASTFGIDGSNDAFVNNGANVAIALATNALISGSISGAPGADLSAESFSIFSATPAGAPVFQSPKLPAVLQGAFFHSVLEPGGIAFVADGIVIRGGDDTLTFVPEPSTPMLLLSALPALFLVRRRARMSGGPSSRANLLSRDGRGAWRSI